jgi:hypothetical protein
MCLVIAIRKNRIIFLARVFDPKKKPIDMLFQAFVEYHPKHIITNPIQLNPWTLTVLWIFEVKKPEPSRLSEFF